MPAGYRRRHRLREYLGRTLPTPCVRCGLLVLPGQSWDVDHLIPLSRGGTDSNVGVAHSRCNRAAGNRPIGGPAITPTVEPSREW